jgi:hypothetical protein
MQILPEFMFIAQVQKKKSNSSKLIARGIAIFYALQKRKITKRDKEKRHQEPL